MLLVDLIGRLSSGTGTEATAAVKGVVSQCGNICKHKVLKLVQITLHLHFTSVLCISR